LQSSYSVMLQRTSFTDTQKYELCLYARDNKGTQLEYHKLVTFPELELVLKEFILIYQSQTILSDVLIIKKAKLLASELKISEGKLQFSQGWLQKFKERNRIRQRILHSEEASADQNAIIESLLLLLDIYTRYPLNRIYNIDETAKSNTSIMMLAGCKKNKEHISVVLCSNANGFYKLNPLIIGNTNDSELDGLINAFSSYNLPNAMKTNEYLTINNENIIYEDESVDKNIIEVDNEDDSIEIVTVSGSLALNNLENIRMFLL
ncbi:246_t:CDS:2, partial [Dentiscutata erythropus]